MDCEDSLYFESRLRRFKRLDARSKVLVSCIVSQAEIVLQANRYLGDEINLPHHQKSDLFGYNLRIHLDFLERQDGLQQLGTKKSMAVKNFTKHTLIQLHRVGM